MSSRIRLLLHGLLLSAVAGLVVGLLACFSQRDATTAPLEGECSFPAGEEVAGSTIVVIRRFAFGPTEIRIRAGEKVSWLNCDLDGHTSTADAGEWQSPLLAPGDAFTQTFPAGGEFTYHCEPHPFMTGRVIVE